MSIFKRLLDTLRGATPERPPTICDICRSRLHNGFQAPNGTVIELHPECFLALGLLEFKSSIRTGRSSPPKDAA